MDYHFAYTIGRTSSYDKGLRENDKLTKIGRLPASETDPEGYPGGWVWKTAEEADEFRLKGLRQAEPSWDPETFSVYLLLLPNTWTESVSTEPRTEDGVHNLLIDALILRRVVIEK